VIDPCSCMVDSNEVDSIHSVKSEEGRLYSKGGMRNGEYVGYWEHFDSLGNVSGRGQYSKTWERCGEWIYYYPNGVVKSRGSYRQLAEPYQVIDAFDQGGDTVYTPEDSLYPYYVNGPSLMTVEYTFEQCEGWVDYDEDGVVIDPKKLH
jgi:antitoxin component YwqK of YwqJK toxin-antitoxin module